MNLPNLLTLLRIFLTPVILIALIYQGSVWALGLYALAILTDLLDGFFARRLGQITLLGAYLDPLADKLLVSVVYVALGISGHLPPWLAVLVVSRDLLLGIGAAVLYFSGLGREVVPSHWGKLSTFLQMITAGGVLLAPVAGGAWTGVLPGLFVLTGGITGLSGFHYVWLGTKALPPGIASGPRP